MRPYCGILVSQEIEVNYQQVGFGSIFTLVKIADFYPRISKPLTSKRGRFISTLKKSHIL